MQLEKLPEVRLVLDDQDLEFSARRAPCADASAPLQQFVDRDIEDAAMPTGRLPGTQQARLRPELHGAERYAEPIGRFPRRADVFPGIRQAPLPETRRTRGMTASPAAECNAKLSGRRAGETR